MEKFMVIASFENNENNNLEVVDYDLTLEEANKIAKEYFDKSESMYIISHKEFIRYYGKN